MDKTGATQAVIGRKTSILKKTQFELFIKQFISGNSFNEVLELYQVFN